MWQVLAYQKSGDKLGWLRSTNESWTRIAIYVSLMALYVLGGRKVKAVSLYSVYSPNSKVSQAKLLRCKSPRYIVQF